MDASIMQKIHSMCDADTYVESHEDKNAPGVPIICISRSYGANGLEIARQLAQQLEVGLYNRETIELLAQRAKGDQHLMHILDERPISAIDELIYGLFGKKGVTTVEMFGHLTELMLAIARTGGVVVGRGAHLIDIRRPMFRLRIEGSLQACTRRVMQRNGLNEKEARDLVMERNQERSQFVKSFYRWYGNQGTFYDMVINSDLFTPEQACRIILRAMHARGFKLPEQAVASIRPRSSGVANMGGVEVFSLTESRKLGKACEDGEIIFRQGSVADRFFVIQEGKVEMLMDLPPVSKRVALLGEGEIFGVESLFTQEKTRLFTARAMGDTRILSVDERAFLGRLHTDPSISFRVLRQMARQISDLDREMAIMLVQQGAVPLEGAWNAMGDQPLLGDADAGRSFLDLLLGRRANMRLLVVEDDADYFQLIHSWLQSASRAERNPLLPGEVQLIRAGTAQESEDMLKKERFSAVLLDLNLPDSQGLDTLNRLRGHYPNTPYVVLSGMDSEKMAVKAVESGADDYLMKNEVDSKHLVLAIRYAMERHRRQAAA